MNGNETQSNNIYAILFRLCPLAVNGRLMKDDIIFSGYQIPAGVGGALMYEFMILAVTCNALNHSLILCTADHDSIPWDSDRAIS